MSDEENKGEIQNSVEMTVPDVVIDVTTAGDGEERALPLNPEMEQALQEALESMENKRNKQARAAGKDVAADERENYNKRIRDLHIQLLEKTKELDAANDRVLRYHADMENFKKRAQKERADIFNYGNEEMARAFIESLDNLERALRHAGGTGDSGLIEGVEMTLRQMNQTFEKFGVNPIKALGEKFDPNYHQAISQVFKDDVEAGVVVEEHQRGYMLKDRLLRPSMVVVSARRPIE